MSMAGFRNSILACVMGALVAAVSLACAPTAWAAAPLVHGVDHYVSGSGADIDVLSLDGDEGDTVFVEVLRNGRVAASRLSYALGQNAGSQDEGGAYTGVVTLNLGSYDPADAYTVNAYADRAQQQLLYSGDLVPVYARVGGATSLAAVRTLSSAETRAFVPQETLYVNGESVRLVRSDAGVAEPSTLGGGLVYDYEPYDAQGTADAHVSYVDESGKTVYVQTVNGIEQDSQQRISIPSVVEADDGNFYRTISFTGSVVAKNPGMLDFTVRCKLIDADLARVAGFYVCTINFVDTEGMVLATDTVNVSGTYYYTVPSTFYLRGAQGLVATYELGSGQQNVLKLSSADDGVADGARTVNVRYDMTGTGTPAQWTVRMVASTEDADVLLGEQSLNVDQTFTPQDIRSGGVNYVPAAGYREYAFDAGSGYFPIQYIYYVPEGYVADEPYDVTVQYVNAADGSVVLSDSVHITPDMVEDFDITSPEQFEFQGTQYVRLDGQDAAIRHNYYSRFRTYTVYYRDINDTLTRDYVITNIRVVYEGTGVANGGLTAALAGDGTAAAGGNNGTNADGTNTDGVQQGRLSDNRTYNVVNGGDGALITNEEGVDSNTERIEGNATPLAAATAPISQNTGVVGATMQQAARTAGVIVAAFAALAAVGVIVIRRRDAAYDYEDE